jgi:hypothetical protein
MAKRNEKGLQENSNLETEVRRNGQLEKKLAAYTLAGAAVLVSPAAARAGTIDYFLNVNQTVSETSVPNTYTFNLSGPSAADIVLTAQVGMTGSGDSTNEIDFATANGAAILDEGGPFGADATALGFGALIDPSSGSWGSSGKLAQWDTTTDMQSGGAWSISGADNYLGFYFVEADGTHVGWADIATTASQTGASFEVLSYAYDTAANTTITAGVPEPSSMALVALGVAGLIALRRRRAGNA